MADERVIAGLSCSHVLGVLADYVDGTLNREQRADVDEHLRGCDWCERFGGEYSATVRSIRGALNADGDVDADASRRLRDRLAEVIKNEQSDS